MRPKCVERMLRIDTPKFSMRFWITHTPDTSVGDTNKVDGRLREFASTLTLQGVSSTFEAAELLNAYLTAFDNVAAAEILGQRQQGVVMYYEWP